MTEDKSSSSWGKVDHESDQPFEFSHEFIKQTTNNFDRSLILGSGGFGTVYKGTREKGPEIAVKVLKNTSTIDCKDFQKEFENIRRFRHRNIVELVGFCNESERVPAEYNGKMVIAEEFHRALCFEYVSNGSLKKHISADELPGLKWHNRYKIIKGICDGLEYLRHGLEYSLWHLDLKPDNILLDNDMIPKLADFGLSRLLLDENTKRTINIQGTRGYMPPEYIHHGIISKEFDIFSLGVIIAKIMVGEEDYYNYADVEGEIFIKHVHDNWSKKLETLPPRPHELYCEQVTKCIQIAVKCMKHDREERPNIQSIVSELRQTEPQTEQFWEEESILLEEGIEDRCPGHPEMAADASRGKAEKGVLSTLPKELPLDFLKTITDQFSEERVISRSAFGTLYMGNMPDGKVIMVKKHAESSPLGGDKAFKNEVQNIMGLQHENVIKLIGFCHETCKKVVLKNGRYIVVDFFESLLCYEYLPKGSLQENLFEVPSKMDWETRFKIIKGICQGLLFLHSNCLVHMDLKPENILLDNNMRPKIASFCLSRYLGQEQTHTNTENVVGSCGYVAPEYLYRGEISTKADIYSLGLLIMESATGLKNCPNNEEVSAGSFIKNVRDNWTEVRIVSENPSVDADCLNQIKICIEIGLRCVKIDPNNRPSIQKIVEILDSFSQRGSYSLLSLQHRQINFPMETKTLSSSSLYYLINNTNCYIAFRLTTKFPRRYLTKLPFCGIVPPKCAYTLTVKQKKLPPSNCDDILTLQSNIALHEDLDTVDPASIAVFLDSTGDEVQEAKVGVACEPLPETIPNQIIAGRNYYEVLSVDIHPTEPWILTSNKGGYVCIWNYETQAEVHSVQVTGETVYSAKFIEREKWFVVGTGDGCIYVYSYNIMEEVDVIEAHDGHGIMSLAVNPTHSFVLSASDDHTIKLWDWTNGWQCIRTFEGHNDRVTQVMFNPRNNERFASASLDHTVKVWNIHSTTCNITWDGHPDGLLCVHYHPRYFQQFLVSGSSDGAAKIWDLETNSCVDALQEHAKGVSSLCWHPELRALVTGSLDGTVRIWNLKSTSHTYRLENIIGLNLGAVHALGNLKESTRIVVGCDQGIALMEINVL